MQSPQSFHQLQFLTPQQQQLLLQAQQNLTSPSGGDIDSRRLRTLLNNRSIILGKDGQSNSVGDVIPNVGSPVQSSCTVMPRTDTEMLIKVRLSMLVFLSCCQNSFFPFHVRWIMNSETCFCSPFFCFLFHYETRTIK